MGTEENSVKFKCSMLKEIPQISGGAICFAINWTSSRPTSLQFSSIVRTIILPSIDKTAILFFWNHEIVAEIMSGSAILCIDLTFGTLPPDFLFLLSKKCSVPFCEKTATKLLSGEKSIE